MHKQKLKSITACSDDDDNTIDQQENTIADFVKRSPDYSALKAALEKAELMDVLDGSDKFTVFAPNNAAFAGFLNANGFNDLNAVPVPLLKNLLLNHVVTGVKNASDLSTGYINSLATERTSEANLSMYVSKTSKVTLNGSSEVTSSDIAVDNGVIHAVNAVIGLPTVVTFAVADPNFSILVAALTRDDQPDFVSILSTPAGTSPAPFTVFAPTNEAFGALLAELGVSGLNDIDAATLTATLNTHVIAGANVRASDLVNGVVGTLGADLIINALNSTITDPNGRVSNIIVVNVQAANGVVHAIDKVLLPQL